MHLARHLDEGRARLLGTRRRVACEPLEIGDSGIGLRRGGRGSVVGGRFAAQAPHLVLQRLALHEQGGTLSLERRALGVVLLFCRIRLLEMCL